MRSKPPSKDKQRLQEDIQRALRDVGVRDPIVQRAVLEQAGRLPTDDQGEAPVSPRPTTFASEGSSRSEPREELRVQGEDSSSPSTRLTDTVPTAQVTERVYEIPLSLIAPSPHQPRTSSNPVADDELVESIRVNGIWSPIQVRPLGNDRYELIAGHRRWKAAGRAGLTTIPALIRNHSHASAASQALIDNLIREDLSPLEEARAFQSLIQNHGFTQQDLASKIGCDPSRISRAVSVLRLPADVLEEFFATGSPMTIKHAEALLPLLHRPAKLSRLARRAKDEQWSSSRLRESITRTPRVNQGAQNVRIVWKTADGETLGFAGSIRFSRNQLDKVAEIREEAHKILRFLDEVEAKAVEDE